MSPPFIMKCVANKAKFAFTAQYLWEMGKAVLDILHLAIQPGGPHPL
ncbi:hypothetical protein [Pseudomonas reactans]|nr:hypothetical protein [Pseudomonas reactans]NWA64747.1 hypothetical protein [Pseudomonas reactans]